MKLVDLTAEADREQAGRPTVVTERRTVTQADGRAYEANVFHWQCDGMLGTYLDFPGHIPATDDGRDAANYPLEKLYRVPAAVIHLDKASHEGAVSAAELKAACPVPPRGGALILNALGKRRYDEIVFRSVFLGPDALDWIVSTGVHLLVSDVYESGALQGVFARLFGAGISTVCQPVGLDRLTAAEVLLTVLPARFGGVTQLPCRAVAEW